MEPTPQLTVHICSCRNILLSELIFSRWQIHTILILLTVILRMEHGVFLSMTYRVKRKMVHNRRFQWRKLTLPPVKILAPCAVLSALKDCLLERQRRLKPELECPFNFCAQITMISTSANILSTMEDSAFRAILSNFGAVLGSNRDPWGL